MMPASTSSSRPEALGPDSAAEPEGSGLEANVDEAELVARAQRDPEAFGALYRQHAAAIQRYLRRRLGDPHLVEDALSETFANALTGLGRYRSRGLPLRAWLYRLATGSVHRSRRRAALRAMERLEVEPAVEVEPFDDSAERARVALLSIAPRYQTAMTLHYLEGLSVATVAQVVGCRPGTVKSRLARGRLALRRALERKDGRP